MDLDKIRKLRTGSWAGRSLSFHPSTASTIDDIRHLAALGALSGTTVIADFQTAGRGRRGSEWVSPAGKNLLCSVLVRPALDLSHWPLLTHAAALAVSDAVRSFDLPARIKWPNDIFVSGRKVAGLLLESTPPHTAILGIGLNVNLTEEEFPDDLRPIATSLARESGQKQDRELVTARLLNALESRIMDLESGGFPDMLHELKERSTLMGKAITLTSGGHEMHTTAIDLGPQGELITQSPGGSIQSFLTADLVRPAI